MSEMLIYCSSDRDLVAQMKRHYHLKPLLLYERGLYGSAAHLPLHAQERLLIALDGRGGDTSNNAASAATLAYSAELSAALLGARTVGGGEAITVAIVTRATESTELPAAAPTTATVDAAAAPATVAVDAAAAPVPVDAAPQPAAAPTTVAVDAAAPATVDATAPPAAAPAPVPADAAAGSWAVAKRVRIEGSGGRHSPQRDAQRSCDSSYYFDLIDIPPRFVLCDAHIAAAPPANDTPAAASPAATTPPVPAAISVRLPSLYAPLYRLLAHYLAPHQILTVVRRTAAYIVAGAATPSSPMAPPLSAVCKLAEHYLALQQRAEYQRDSATHQQIIEHCMTRYRLSQFQASELRQRLQHYPQINPATVTALLRCRSYADITATLN